LNFGLRIADLKPHGKQELKKRYFLATKQDRSIILDEFCIVCSFNRKYAIRLIHKKEVVYKKKGRTK
jgi:hypothetical protein